MDYEGRILMVDFGDYYFVNVYTPNAGSELKRLADRQSCFARREFWSQTEK